MLCVCVCACAYVCVCVRCARCIGCGSDTDKHSHKKDLRALVMQHVKREFTNAGRLCAPEGQISKRADPGRPCDAMALATTSSGRPALARSLSPGLDSSPAANGSSVLTSFTLGLSKPYSMPDPSQPPHPTGLHFSHLPSFPTFALSEGQGLVKSHSGLLYSILS